MATCTEQPEELATALSAHHTFTVQVLIAAPAIQTQLLPSIQERLTREKREWFQASLAQVLKAMTEVTENSERVQALPLVDATNDKPASMASESVLSEDNPYGDLPSIFEVLEECSVGLADKATDVRSLLNKRYGKSLTKTLLAQLSDGVRASSMGVKRRVYLHDGQGLRIKERAP